MKFQCDSAARTPIYRQLIEQVREAVARGRVQEGERLPSVRQLSNQRTPNWNARGLFIRGPDSAFLLRRISRNLAIRLVSVVSRR